MPRTIAIGDIHGCAIALAKLIEIIAPQPDDTVVPLVDYVDRGIDSRGVIDQLIALRGAAGSWRSSATMKKCCAPHFIPPRILFP